MIAPHTAHGGREADNNITGSLISDIQETRSRICNAFLITIAIIAIPALATSLYRAIEIGWQPIMTAHITIAALLWGITLFRARIPYKYQAGFIIVMFLSIGLGGIIQFGLLAGGTVFLVVSSPIATLLFGGRAGLATLTLALCGAVVIGFLTVAGDLQPGFDITAYALAPSSWLTSILGWSLTSIALTVSLHVFNTNLINALKTSRQHEKALRKHQLELEKTIDEKNESNRKLQKAFEEIKTLRGIIPICSYCHSIRDDEGAWNKIEQYISTHSEAQFSHGICPKCLYKLRADNGLNNDK